MIEDTNYTVKIRHQRIDLIKTSDKTSAEVSEPWVYPIELASRVKSCSCRSLFKDECSTLVVFASTQSPETLPHF